jgi:hypothetical protein
MEEKDKPLLDAKKEDKPAEKPQPKAAKVAEPVIPIALKTCVVHLEGADVTLVQGQPIEGLNSRELRHLKFHKFIQ